MRLSTLASALVCALASQSAFAADVYRCTSPRGAVTYQQTPCPGPEGRAMAIPQSFPEVNRVERDRLLQREAALDARLLKRAEIEAAERIAREERFSRERVAQAMLEAERARAAQALGPIVVIARPRPVYRHPRPHGWW